MAYENLKGTIFELFENINIANKEEKLRKLNKKFGKNIERVKFEDLEIILKDPKDHQFLPRKNQCLILHYTLKFGGGGRGDTPSYLELLGGGTDDEYKPSIEENDILKMMKIITDEKGIIKLIIFYFCSINDFSKVVDSYKIKTKILKPSRCGKKFFYPNDFFDVEQTPENVQFFGKLSYVTFNEGNKGYKAEKSWTDEELNIGEGKLYNFYVNSSNSGVKVPIVTYKDLKNAVVGYVTDEKEKEISENKYWADKEDSDDKPINFIFDPSEENLYYYEIKYKGRDKEGQEKEFIKYTNGKSRYDICAGSGADVLGYFAYDNDNIKIESLKKSSNQEIQYGDEIYKVSINVKEDISDKENDISKNTVEVSGQERMAKKYIADATGKTIEEPKKRVVKYDKGVIAFKKPNAILADQIEIDGKRGDIITDDLVSDAGPSSGKLEKFACEDQKFIDAVGNFEAYIDNFYFCQFGALTYGYGQTISSSKKDEKLFLEAEKQFRDKNGAWKTRKYIYKYVNGVGQSITFTPEIIDDHIRLTVSSDDAEKIKKEKIYFNNRRLKVGTYGSYNIIIETGWQPEFYEKIIKESFGVTALEDLRKTKGKNGSLKSYCKQILAEAIYEKEKFVFGWLVDNIVEENYRSQYSANGINLEQIIKGKNAGDSSVFKFLTQTQYEHLVNTAYQGHIKHFWNPIGTIPKGKNGKAGRKFINALNNNDGKLSNYAIFCRVVCNQIRNRNAYIKNHPEDNLGCLFRNAENREDIIKDFTLTPAQEAETSNFYLQQIEKLKKEAEDAEMGAVNIDTITITAIANRSFTIGTTYKEINKDAIKKAIEEKSAAYYVIPIELDEEYLDAVAQATADPLGGKNSVNWEEEKKFMNRWSINYKGIKEDFLQNFVDVNKYYDFYSGMTPYVEVHFRDSSVGSDAWNIINSIDHPYIKSLQVTDKGVKKVVLQLFDKDFASYQVGILKSFDNISFDTTEEKEKKLKEANTPENTKNLNELNNYRNLQNDAGTKEKKGVEVYSLDTLIKRALMNVNDGSNNDNNKETYSNDPQEDMVNGYLKISDYNKSLGPGNLKIRYGYCDDNFGFPTNKAEADYANDKKEAEELKDIQGYKRVEIGSDGIGNRTNRWWDVKNGDSSETYKLTWNYKIDGEKLVSGKTNLNNSAGQVRAAAQSQIDVSEGAKRKTINDKTTLKSYLQEYMITGYKTTLANNGILYTIEGIEVKDVEVMRKRFLQRYAEVSTYPLEVLYVLMRIFNENDSGKIIDNGVKLLYLNDVEKFNSRPTDSFNMSFDFSSLSEDKVANMENNFKDVYWANFNDMKFSDQYLKKISLNFGSESALINYNKVKEKPPLYKSLDSLMSEFCSACPTRKEYETNDTVGYDKDGNEIKNEGYKAAQTLSWMATKSEDENDKNVYIILYYKKIRKLETIKKYTWGPYNPNKTIVKRIQIQNNNEFALLSSVTSTNFNGKTLVSETVKNRGVDSSKGDLVQVSIDGKELLKKYEEESSGFVTTYASNGPSTKESIEQALKTSMYSGSIEILGDPSMEFNLRVQPYMYPIYLDVLIPVNDLYFSPLYKKDINIYDEKFGSMNGKMIGNQRRHELSGFYVITGIIHNFSSSSSSGYTTTLEVSKYPMIENDILTDETKKTYKIKVK